MLERRAGRGAPGATKAELCTKAAARRIATKRDMVSERLRLTVADTFEPGQLARSKTEKRKRNPYTNISYHYHLYHYREMMRSLYTLQVVTSHIQVTNTHTYTSDKQTASKHRG